MSPERAGGLNRDWPGRAAVLRSYGGQLDQDMVDQIDRAHTPSERAGVHTSRALDREAAREVLARKCPAINEAHGDDVLDALEACVVPDPRTTCASRWVVAEDESDEYHGDWHCALPIGHGGPHVEARYGYRWNDDHATSE